MSDLSDQPRLAPASPDLWEAVALGIAREERTLTELSERIERQQASLAKLRELLVKTLWPRPRTSKETSL